MAQDKNGIEHLELKDGPSKWDLMQAMFVQNELRPAITFTTEQDGRTLAVSITYLGREDGSGESFLFQGTLVNSGRNAAARGYFHARTRKGWIEILPANLSNEDVDRGWYYGEWTTFGKLPVGATFLMDSGPHAVKIDDLKLITVPDGATVFAAAYNRVHPIIFL
ncbi:MAG: hypothetical protein Q7T01_01560 [bacterium]|nr:hypothetical protein [bacterium]